MPSILQINDLRGGQSDDHPATLADNQIVLGQNVSYWKSFLGGRRNGSTSPVSALASDLVALILYTPNSTSSNDRLWSLNAAGAWVSRDSAYTATTVVPSPGDLFISTYGANGVSLHGKLFLAAKSTDSGAVALNRLHVYDGTTLRRAGLAPPVLAPNVANTGAGSFSGTRYYRVRFIAMSGTTVLRRSEPSPTTTFVPSGTGASARITQPAVVSEGETHWEVEESINNADFYRIATVILATTTYDDSLTTATVATSGTLSADIGDYTVQESYRYLAVDRDRLVGFGNFEDASKDSDVVWTPVGTDSTGVGNDERVPTDTQNRISLDGQDGGPITGGVSFDGRIIAFKQHRLYSLTNTGIRTSVYLPQPVSRTYGALPYSIVEGVDNRGLPALYFIDAKVGPMRLGANGLEILAKNLQRKFLTEVNFDATTRVASAVYHADKGEVWWHLAGTGQNVPTFRWVFNVDTGGSTFDTLPNSTLAAVLWQRKPHITAPARLIKCDVDNAQDDYGNNFQAYLVTKSYELGSLWKRIAIKSGVVEADAATGVTLSISLIRDYGLETSTVVTFSLTPAGSEEYVLAKLDNIKISEATAVQIQIGDAAAVATLPWRLQRVTLLWAENGSNIN